MTSRDRASRRSERLYGAMLHLYPASFREEYSGEMRAAFRRRWRGQREERGRVGLAALWLGLLADLLRTAPREHVDVLAQDLRHASRVLAGRGHRAFAVASLATIALGVGAVTLVFSIYYAVLTAPLPFGDPERVVALFETHPALGRFRHAVSIPNFVSWRERTKAFASLSAVRTGSANVVIDGRPDHLTVAEASANLWQTLRISPVVGRAFRDADEARGAAPVALIGERFWRSRLASVPDAIGRVIRLAAASYTVVGVVPQDVGFSASVDVWVPLSPDPTQESRGDRRLRVYGRLAPGMTSVQADADASRVAGALAREFPADCDGWSARVASVRDGFVDSQVRRGLEVMLATVVILLLIAGANIATLQVARAAERAREVGVRLALGASRARLVRQMVTETGVLAVVGGGLGLGLAWGAVRALPAVLPEVIPRLSAVSVSIPVLLAAVASIGVTALVAGLLPAVVALRTRLQDTLHGGGRVIVDRRTGLARRVLVTAQMMLATVLIIGAALMAQSAWRLLRAPVGVSDPEHVLVARLARGETTRENYRQNLEFYRTVMEQTARLPGVQSVGLTSEVPLGGINETGMGVVPQPRPADLPERGIPASWRIVTGSYFRTMGIPLRAGQVFDERRDPPGRLIILNDTLARRLWADGQDPIGRTVRLSNGRQFTVSGIVGDVRQVDLSLAEPAMYLPTTWYLWESMVLVARTTIEPAALASAVRGVVARVDPVQAVFDIRSHRSVVDASSSRPRLNAGVLVAFAAAAWLLALVGVVGIVSYSVARRTPELAVRLVFGASPRQVRRTAMAGGLLTCLSGVIAGTVAVWWLSTLLAGLLYEVGVRDPATYAASAATLLGGGVLACWFPARRATRISPSVALRGE